MISKRIDRMVEWTKWPSAFIAVFTVPCTVWAIFIKLADATQSPLYLVMFIAGLGLLWFASRTSLGGSVWVATFFRWLHDGTQALVAMAMLHPVVSIKKRESETGEPRVRWLGRGNWVMLVAPYTLPVSTGLLWLVSLLLFASLRSAALGFGLGLHLAYVIHQWRTGTSELRRLRRRFCWLFLPPVNLAISGLILAFAIEGFSGAWDFMYDWCSAPYELWNWGASWFTATDPIVAPSETPSPKAS